LGNPPNKPLLNLNPVKITFLKRLFLPQKPLQIGNCPNPFGLQINLPGLGWNKPPSF